MPVPEGYYLTYFAPEKVLAGIKNEVRTFSPFIIVWILGSAVWRFGMPGQGFSFGFSPTLMLVDIIRLIFSPNRAAVF